MTTAIIPATSPAVQPVPPQQFVAHDRVAILVPPASQWHGKFGTVARVVREGVYVHVDGDTFPLPLFFERFELEGTAERKGAK